MFDFLSPPWEGKYSLSYCHLCDTFSIRCPVCGNGSCGGGGCDECKDAFKRFGNYKIHIQDYLSESEKAVYNKIIRLRRVMEDSLARGERQIDFKKCNEDGYLSEMDQETFKEFLI